MAEEFVEKLRLSLMQDYLPIGIAIIERIKTDGPRSIFDVLNIKEPLIELRNEGESSAKSVREMLDQIIPGLGNPVMSVKVSVEEDLSSDSKIDNLEELMKTLTNIEHRLVALEQHLQNNN